ncbi:hypothetical protein PRK78_005934 [Emydomyces testavorans]|uniref:LPXTG-motif cell wall anchor domain protein n=1 Tax=Emydomyces testavorans TaxID=2070801 RepID=A0AAF0IKF9_9EURO|nr:hypothetical protein PRK78_005934 [Emydomyces testavorans]
MRLEAASSSTVTTLTSRQQDNRICCRNRSQTDPMVNDSTETLARNRRSIDFVSQRHKPSNSLQFTNASSLSSESFSNPALANFSPRKIAFTSASRTGASSSIPTLLLQTPRTSRDLDRRPQSPVLDNAPPSASTTPSAASSTISPSDSLHPASTIDSRPSYLKRAPASRSSLGIETASGPPPALSTQRNLVQERHPPSNLEYSKRPRSFGLSSTRNSSSKSSPTSTVDVGMRTDLSRSSLLEQKRSSLPTRTVYSSRQKDRPTSTVVVPRATESPEADDEEDLTATIDTSGHASSKDSDDSRQKSEDVFLNIAKSATNRRGSGRQKSKFGLSGLSSRIRSNEETSSPDRQAYDYQDISPLSGHGTGILKTPASAPPLNQSSRLNKYAGSTSRSTIGLPRNRLGRTNRELSPEPTHYEQRGSTQDTIHSRAYRQSNLSDGRTHHAQSNSDDANRSRLEAERARYDGTESTLSTTAPSTVWDELDDLKSRIRKLELTGKLPSSSAAAMSTVSVERPRTATTTVTTLSSSPKQGRKTSTSPNTSDAAAVDAQIQSLLGAALAKAKAALSPEIYSTLEATANDALNLASMFSPNTQQLGMSVVSAAAGTDRQFKRKIDSMCRSLTELSIALADEKLTAMSKNRPGSRDATANVPQLNGVDAAPSTSNYRRSASHEPEDLGRQGGSLGRALTTSRLEGRRTSLANISNNSSTVRGSQEASDSQTTLKPSTPTSRIGRSSTTLLRNNNRRHDEEDANDKSSSIASRPISRVFSDIPDPKPRSSLLARSSREFSPLHDQQQQQDQLLPPQHTTHARATPANQSAIPLRRSYLSTGSHLSTASHLNVQPGYRRYGSSVINAGATTTPNNEAETASSPLTATATGSGRTASHFSSMQQLRPRTNSFGTRRLSLRRVVGSGGNVVDGVE